MGSYSLRGQQGSQRGRFYQSDSDIIVGVLYDSNNGLGSGTPKLTLGRKKDSLLTLAKIAPFHESQKPVYWFMEQDREFTPCVDATARFIGSYLFGCGIDEMNLLSSLLLDVAGSEWPSKLESVAESITSDDPIIKRLNVDEEQWQKIQEDASSRGQTGELLLKIRRGLK